jgi:DNA-binding NtrC family response regulator
VTKILVVEDEAALRLALSGLFRKEGHDVVLAAGAPEAIAALERDAFDLVVTDLALGKGGSGLDVLREARRVRAETPVVVITAHGSEKIAVEAMKQGAAHYVPKPFDNDELKLVVARELERTRVAREHRLLLERVSRERGMGAMVGTGPAMRRVFDVVSRVAETDLGVLVRGESGTGKELVAQAIHEASPRRSRPFVAVNCAAMAAELVESELFGHEKGAFTGAESRRIGRFEAAGAGTIFLDEIGDMPLPTQAKVLRVLESRTLERVGSTTPIRTEARVIAATHRDLEADVREGRFREDLYYRLRVVEIVVPPLRERAEDVPALALLFAERLAQRMGRPPRPFSPGALGALSRHGWPGNVRELRHAVEQAAVLAAGESIEAADLQLGQARASGVPGPSSGIPFAEAKQRAVETFERAWISDALAAHGGNVSRTAAAIGMARQSLQQKLRELGLRGGRDEVD